MKRRALTIIVGMLCASSMALGAQITKSKATYDENGASFDAYISANYADVEKAFEDGRVLEILSGIPGMKSASFLTDEQFTTSSQSTTMALQKRSRHFVASHNQNSLLPESLFVSEESKTKCLTPTCLPRYSAKFKGPLHTYGRADALRTAARENLAKAFEMSVDLSKSTTPAGVLVRVRLTFKSRSYLEHLRSLVEQGSLEQLPIESEIKEAFLLGLRSSMNRLAASMN